MKNIIKSKLIILFLLCFSMGAYAWGDIGGQVHANSKRCNANVTIDGIETVLSVSCTESYVTCGITGNPDGHTCFIDYDGEVFYGDESMGVQKMKIDK